MFVVCVEVFYGKCCGVNDFFWIRLEWGDDVVELWFKVFWVFCSLFGIMFENYDCGKFKFFMGWDLNKEWYELW